ncbi:MAG: phosphatidate cytidylyltransferase [Lachnospiraceae bacterium]|nr:phosphatidate cytidylyltransferase [Lachnospiraceae bacterium]
MFAKRLISGICLLAVLAVCLLCGGNVLLAFSVFISVVGFYEMMKATGTLRTAKTAKADDAGDGANGTERSRYSGLYAVGIIGIICYYTLLSLSAYYRVIASDAKLELSMLCVTGVVLAILIVYVLTFPKYRAPEIMATIFSFLYAPVMLSYIYQTRCLENGIYIVWLIFISSWMCDTSAYAVGMLIGKHKMAPKLSPKKSVEGGIGGIVGAALLGCLYGWILQNMGIMEVRSFWVYPLIAGVGGAISQLGDLAASAVKRNYDIKDYGNLIPGHGGILDRFDSVIFTAPMIYYLAVILL